MRKFAIVEVIEAKGKPNLLNKLAELTEEDLRDIRFCLYTGDLSIDIKKELLGKLKEVLE